MHPKKGERATIHAAFVFAPDGHAGVRLRRWGGAPSSARAGAVELGLWRLRRSTLIDMDMVLVRVESSRRSQSRREEKMKRVPAGLTPPLSLVVAVRHLALSVLLRLHAARGAGGSGARAAMDFGCESSVGVSVCLLFCKFQFGAFGLNNYIRVYFLQKNVRVGFAKDSSHL